MKPDFQTSYNKLISIEGLLSDNPNDKGGLTYKGISRTNNPDWPGWKIIDSIAAKNRNAALYLRKIKSLQEEVLKFYRTEYWNKLQCEKIQYQNIADELLESAVNFGVKEESKILQKTINLLNRNTALYPDIKVDGIIGKQTLSTLNRSIAINGFSLVYNTLNFYQAKKYIEIMESDPTQEEFIGWFKRIELIKWIE